MSAIKVKLVVAALTVDGRGQVLITRRRDDQVLGGYWEFPGGKMEEGESPTDALHREIREELGCDVIMGRIYDVMFHRYPTYDVLMLVYVCALAPGAAPAPVLVAELAWVPTARLGEYEVLPADSGIVSRLQDEGAPPPPRSD